MEFKEMQILWNSQNNEKLYAINEDALYAQIKRKGKSIDRKVSLVEWMMIGANFIAGAMLILDAWTETVQMGQVIFGGLYLAYSAFGLIRRLARRKEIVRFELTLLGELDKAIWNINYLIRQARTMIVWYLLPLILAASALVLFNGKFLLATGLLLVLLPAGYFGGRWEVNKFYLPKKRELESLRESLVSPQPS